MFIAVVCKRDERARNKHGEWSSFIDESQDAAIKRAIIARDEWEEAGHGPYIILTGRLPFEVKAKPGFTLERA